MSTAVSLVILKVGFSFFGQVVIGVIAVLNPLVVDNSLAVLHYSRLDAL
jgi:hypothetical protein